MKKVLLTLALVITMSAPAFATDIAGWGTALTDYPGSSTASVGGDAAGGVVWSRHNLSSYGEHYQATTSVSGTSTATGIEPLTVITTEICVFCHTPHFGRTDTAPLWNRGTSATGYVAYGASEQTLAGTSTSVGGSSLACLSCHDGVTTLDNLINQPGKGSRTNGTGADQGWYFGEIGTQDVIGDTASGGDAAFNLSNKAASRLNIGANNAGSRDIAAVDLSNDHPIGVVYYGDPTGVKVASLRPPDTVINSINMSNARMNYGDSISHGLSEDTPTGYFGRSDNLWAVKGFIRDDATTINDLLREGNMVQCASCHDPHYKNQTNTDPGVVCAYFKKQNDWVAGDGYTDEVDNPSYEGCISASTAGTVVPTDTGVAYGTLAPDVANMTAYNEHYLTDVDSDGLFLRRVGGNSNSGVCRTCHNK